MMDFLNNISRLIKNKIYTNKCPYCNKVIETKEYACKKCLAKFPKNIKINYAVGGHICYSAFAYKDIFKRALLSLKFKNCGNYSSLIAKAMYDRMYDIIKDDKIDLITCVPMHKTGLEQRGYNQAELLARDFAQLCGIPYADTLKQTKKNCAQHTVSRNKRAVNVRGVYIVADKKLVIDKRILIIDDVITTGNTLGECAKTLINSGSGMIFCATMCAVEQ